MFVAQQQQQQQQRKQQQQQQQQQEQQQQRASFSSFHMMEEMQMGRKRRKMAVHLFSLDFPGGAVSRTSAAASEKIKIPVNPSALGEEK